MGTLCATPSLGVPWGPLGPIYIAFWKHFGDISTTVDGFGKQFGPDFETRVQAKVRETYFQARLPRYLAGAAGCPAQPSEERRALFQ